MVEENKIQLNIQCSIQNDTTKCIICSQKQKIKNKYFASCEHADCCIGCAAEHMKSQISAGRYPTCISGCQQKMITNTPNCLYKYFDHQAKNLFEKFQRQTKNKRISNPPCQVPDCPGVIINNSCTRCLQQYCQICRKRSHSIILKCQPPINQQNKNLIICPSCNYGYERGQGCGHMTCMNESCRYEFCEICKQNWTVLHHRCSLTKKLQGEASTNPGSINSRNQKQKQKRIGCCLIF